MKRALFLLSLFFLFPLIGRRPLFTEEQNPVLLLEVRGTINPAVARYILRGLEEARKREAPAVVIQLDTPGGLEGSMRRILQAVLDSPVPVIVYVAPSGSRAASAGAFITLAAHVAAMAPGTNIGAAHPVRVGEDEGNHAVMDQKLENDAAATIRSIAQLRGRDSEWAMAAVKESRSSTAQEAKEKGVIDFVADDLNSLLVQIENRQVRTVFGLVTLSTAGRPMERVSMSAMEKILHRLAHPHLAYILLLLGIYGLIFELATPGAVFPGVVGAILLVLALVALETLEVNWGGLALIGLSVLFFIADIHLTGYGALTVGGTVAFVLGSMILFPSTRIPSLKLPLGMVGAAAAATVAFFLGVVGVGIRALKRKVTSGIEGLIGAEGLAKTGLNPEGIVHIRGEEWRARSVQPVRPGAKVRVIRLEGLTVHVEPL